MKIPEAITKAVKGGWKELHGEITIQKNGTNSQIYHYDWAWGVTATGLPRGLPLPCVFLDPSFWQSLGKAMGWETKEEKYCECDEWVNPFDGGAEFCSRCGKKLNSRIVFTGKMWETKWHRFIDHLAEGKTVESFFETL